MISNKEVIVSPRWARFARYPTAVKALDDAYEFKEVPRAKLCIERRHVNACDLDVFHVGFQDLFTVRRKETELSRIILSRPCAG